MLPRVVFVGVHSAVGFLLQELSRGGSRARKIVLTLLKAMRCFFTLWVEYLQTTVHFCKATLTGCEIRKQMFLSCFLFQGMMIFKMKTLENFRFSLGTTEIEGQKMFERKLF